MKQSFNETVGSILSLVKAEDCQNTVTLLLLGALGAFVVLRSALKLYAYLGKSSRAERTDERVAATGNGKAGQDPNKNRHWGEWKPVKFEYPAVEASPQRLSEIKPIPYRPFKWGAYHVTMGLRNMPWSDWIELDKDHVSYHAIKTRRVKTRGRAAVRVLDDQANPGVVKGAGEAAIELVHELAEYLSRRYPGDFEVIRHSRRGVNSVNGQNPAVESKNPKPNSNWGWDDLPSIKTIKMTSLNVSYDLPLSIDDGIQAPERAMEIAGLLIQDDLAIMVEGLDGKYYFQAGSICLPVCGYGKKRPKASIRPHGVTVCLCSHITDMIPPNPGFWRLVDKIGMPLDDIHITGHVPQYKEKLQGSLGRFFQRMTVDKPVIRNNYFVQINGEEKADAIDVEELAWAQSSLGDEDAYENGAARLAKPEETKVENIRLRSERQTLRRLRESGAIVFTIRTYLTPMSKLGEEKGVAGRLASALRSWPEDVGEYKGKTRGNWWGSLLRYLDERA